MKGKLVHPALLSMLEKHRVLCFEKPTLGYSGWEEEPRNSDISLLLCFTSYALGHTSDSSHGCSEQSG